MPDILQLHKLREQGLNTIANLVESCIKETVERLLKEKYPIGMTDDYVCLHLRPDLYANVALLSKAGTIHVEVWGYPNNSPVTGLRIVEDEEVLFDYEYKV